MSVVIVVEIRPLLPDAAERALVAEALRDIGPASVLQLSHHLGARRVTISAALAELARRGLVTRTGQRWSVSPHPSMGWPERTA
jgi:DNA-binding IclR family transcriptional regulator